MPQDIPGGATTGAANTDVSLLERRVSRLGAQLRAEIARDPHGAVSAMLWDKVAALRIRIGELTTTP